MEQLEECSEPRVAVTAVPDETAASEGPFRLSITPAEINQLPRRFYEGPIHLVREPSQVPEAVKILSRDSVLGFDTETRPAFRKGQSYLPSLMQLAGERGVYVFQLALLEDVAPLFALLEKKRILKVGVAMGYDVKKLQELNPFKAAGFLDLEKLTDSVGIINNGLRKLAAIVLGFRISKGEQRSNWGRNDLTERQLSYAATDAWVSREIYLALIAAGAKIQPEK